MDAIERGIEIFMVGFRTFFVTVPSKLHILDDHVVYQLRRFKVGLGLFNEQGAESTHKIIKRKWSPDMVIQASPIKLEE